MQVMFGVITNINCISSCAKRHHYFVTLYDIFICDCILLQMFESINCEKANNIRHYLNYF